MTIPTLAKRLLRIQRRYFNRIKFLTESCRIRARMDLEKMTDDQRIESFLLCPDCGEPRIPLDVAKSLAGFARTVPQWEAMVDDQEYVQSEIEAMNAMGPHQ